MRISEIYPSIQGEGQKVGTPTLFVRTAGCNLRCPGWPCDTPHAIDPSKYRKEWRNYEPLELQQYIESFGLWKWIPNVCLTGGEPFLQPSEELQELVRFFNDSGKSVDVFTNGTITFPGWCAYANLQFVMDWKLPGSGELQGSRKQQSTYLERYLDQYSKLDDWGGPTNSVKFTVASEHDLDEAVHLWDTFFMKEEGAPRVYVGVVWGKMTEAQLVKRMLERRLPWRMNVQMHNYIWDRTQRGI
jgi:7-carboxy-7-deazaguanine synthase